MIKLFIGWRIYSQSCRFLDIIYEFCNRLPLFWSIKWLLIISKTILAGILQKTQHLISNDSYIFVVVKEKMSTMGMSIISPLIYLVNQMPLQGLNWRKKDFDSLYDHFIWCSTEALISHYHRMSICLSAFSSSLDQLTLFYNEGLHNISREKIGNDKIH